MIIGVCMIISVPASEARAEQTDLTELPLEELMNIEVYSASKFSQKTTEAPASVTIITAADIKTYGYRTLADILKSVRGLYVTYDRAYQYVGVRGFNRPGDYNSRILLLVDGYRVNDALYDSASIGQEFFLDVDLIDRVEVVRGPGSSIYGSNAFFSVMNIITRRAKDVGGLEVSGDAAGYDTGTGRITYGGRSENGVALLLSATYSGTKGQDLYFPEFDSPATNNGVAQGLDYDRAKRVFARLAYGEVTLTGAYAERVKGVPTAFYGGVFNDSRTQTADSQTVLDLGYSRDVSRRLNLSSHVYYGGYFYDGTFPYDQPPITVNKDESAGEWWGAEAKLVGKYDEHKLVTGVEYQDNYRQDQKNYDVLPAVLYLDSKQNSNRRAMYLQDEMSLNDGLLLNAGLRCDHYSTAGNACNPRVALIYSPKETTSLKLLYGTAFRAPNAFELYYNDGSLGSKPNQDLKPEKITTYEFIAEHQLLTNFRLTASVYRNEIHNLINYIVDPADGLFLFQNIGEVEANGAEFEAERTWSSGARLRASYARQIARDEDTHEELSNSPRSLAKLNCSMPLFGKAIRTGAELQYTSRRKTLSNAYTGGHTIAHLTLLSSKLAKGLELSASVYNLFDKRYADPGLPEHVQDVIPQDGRNYRVKLTYIF
jgi:iron complex outermembrane receptor protein